MSEWQPIETAPTPEDDNGIADNFLVTNFVEYTVAYWSDGWHISYPGAHATDTSLGFTPSHWMPLPDPPAPRSRSSSR
jgi:hypothetical protein